MWLRASLRVRRSILLLTAWSLLSSAAHGADGGLARRPSLGVALTDLPAGVTISALVPGSAAERAGLRIGDLVRRLGDAPVTSAAGMIAQVRRIGALHPTRVVVLREGAERVFPLRLGEAPREQGEGFETRYGAVAVRGALRRTLLTLPRPAQPRGALGRWPAVLIVGGIGCYSVDAPGDANDAYLSLAHDLARRGIASLRVEKTGVGDSQGPPCLQSDLALEAEGYAAALAALKREPAVDPKRIVLLGHSIGALIAPGLAAHDPVAGLIVAEAIGRNWFEYELLNLRRQLVLGGDAPDAIDAALASKERCMHRLLIDRADEAAIEAVEPACKTHNAYPASAAYMQQAAAVNVAQLWTRLPAILVLAIYGGGDFVTDLKDHERIVEIVASRRPGAATLKVIPGMDHHFDQAGPPQAAYDLRVRQHRSPPYEHAFSDTVAAWIEDHVCAAGRCAPA
jgi:uncharacterized protein